MKLEEMLKVVFLNILGVCILILCYSDMFLGLSVSDHSAFRATCAVMILPAILILLLVYDYRKLLKKTVTISEADDSDDMEYLLDKYRSTIFAKQVSIIKGQLRLFEKREKVFQEILEENELENAEVFEELTEHLEKQIFLNVQKALRIMQVFNYERFRTQGSHADPAYHDQIRTCNAYVETNEQILTKFDALISEISRVREQTADDSMQRASDMAAALRKIRMADGEEGDISELEKKYR